MKTGQFLIGLIFLFVVAQPASAEFYRYVDEHGNVMFTDDFSKVPVDQRNQIKTYEESITQPKPEIKGENAPADKQKTNSETASEQKRLESQQEALSREYDTLMAERAKLDQEKNQAVTNAQIKEHNKKIAEFNARIKAYEEKRDVHTEEIKKFKADRKATETD